MTRVPTSSRPAPPPASERSRPAEGEAKAGKAEAAPEAQQGWAPADAPGESRGLEKHAHEAAHEQHAAEHADAQESKELHKELREKGEKAAPGKVLKKGQAADQGKRPAGPGKPAAKPARDGFERLSTRSAALTSTSHSNLSAVGQVQNKLQGTLVKEARPPDAFALLREARDKGVLFQEDAHREGHTEDEDDPALADAVEEAIRLLFGVRGILRIGPGRNDDHASVVVVVANQGFGEASLQRVPPEVNGFATLVAIPFELLPLRKER